MSLISRYILSQFLKVFLLCLGGVLLSYLTIEFLEKIRKFTVHGAEISWVVRYFLLRLPRILFDITPLAALLSTLLTLGNLSRNAEFTALKALGVGPRRILIPFLGFGAIASLMLLALNLSIIPEGLKKSDWIKNVQIEKRPSPANFIQDRVWTKLGPTTLSNIQWVDTRKQTLYGVSIYRLSPEFALPEILEAKEMRYEAGEWFLYEGVRRRFFDDGSMEVKPFDRRPYPLERTPEDFRTIDVDEDQMRYWDLSRYVDRLKRDGYTVPRYEVNLLQKVAYPFTTLVVVFLGVPFALKDRRSGGLARGIGISLAVGFLYWLTYSTLLSFGYGGLLPPLLAAWLTHLLFTGVGAYLLMTVPW